jgi:hypothetical protein
MMMDGCSSVEATKFCLNDLAKFGQADGLPYDFCDNDVAAVTINVAGACDPLPRHRRMIAFRSSGRRREASEMISRARVVA